MTITHLVLGEIAVHSIYGAIYLVYCFASCRPLRRIIPCTLAVPPSGWQVRLAKSPCTPSGGPWRDPLRDVVQLR